MRWIRLARTLAMGFMVYAITAGIVHRADSQYPYIMVFLTAGVAFAISHGMVQVVKAIRQVADEPMRDPPMIVSTDVADPNHMMLPAGALVHDLRSDTTMVSTGHGYVPVARYARDVPEGERRLRS